MPTPPKQPFRLRRLDIHGLSHRGLLRRAIKIAGDWATPYANPSLAPEATALAQTIFEQHLLGDEAALQFVDRLQQALTDLKLPSFVFDRQQHRFRDLPRDEQFIAGVFLVGEGIVITPAGHILITPAALDQAYALLKPSLAWQQATAAVSTSTHPTTQDVKQYLLEQPQPAPTALAELEPAIQTAIKSFALTCFIASHSLSLSTPGVV